MIRRSSYHQMPYLTYFLANATVVLVRAFSMYVHLVNAD